MSGFSAFYCENNNKKNIRSGLEDDIELEITHCKWAVLLLRELQIKNNYILRIFRTKTYFFPYEERLKSSKSDQDSLMECDETKCIFQHRTLRSTHFIHLCCGAWIPLVKEIASCYITGRPDVVIIAIRIPSKVFFDLLGNR